MPTVPRLSGPQVETAALPSVRVPVGAPSGAFDRGPVLPDLAPAARLVAEIAAEERQKADRVLLADAEAQLAARETALLHGDAPERPGVLSRRGKDAFAAPEEAEAAWTQAVDEVLAGVGSDRVKEAVRRSAQARYASINGAVQRHVAGERRTYAETTTRALLDNERMAAAANYLDGDRIAAAVTRQTAVLRDYARDHGLPPEEAARLQVEAVSGTHLAVVDRYVQAGDHRGAAAYYAAHKDEVAGDKRGSVERVLEQGQRLGAAQAAADAIFAGDATVTRGAALAAARAIPDPETRADTENLVRQRLADRDAAEREAREAAMERAVAAIDAGRSPSASDLAGLKPSERASLRALQRANAAGTGPQHDDATYYSLKLAAADPAKRAEFAATNLLEYRARLGESEFKELVGLQARARQGQDAPELKSFITTAARVNAAALAAGLDPAKKQHRERVATFRRGIDDRLQAEQAAKGRPLTPAEEQEIIDRQTIEVFVDDRGRDPSLRLGEVTPAQAGRTYIPLDRIPEGERAEIDRQFRAGRGRAPTTRELEQAYAAAAAGDAARFQSIIRSPLDRTPGGR